MKPRILFVDDEPNILASFERLFRKEYSVQVARSGREALALIDASSPVPVVLSDMRMPEMNGAEFLTRVRDMAPETVRMVLTGETEIGAAVQAVNDGAVFRFLLKPCAEPVLRGALAAAVRQFQLQKAEQDLLEKTLRGSVSVLAEVLSLVNPTAFARSMRIQRYVRHIVQTLGLDDGWQFEIAGMLSQIGCVTLPPHTVEAVYAGERLNDEERRRYQMHATIAHDLLVRVPRLEPVAAMIARQDDPVPPGDRQHDVAAAGAQLLRVCLAFDEQIARGLMPAAALQTLRARPDQFSARMVDALASVRFGAVTHQSRVVPVAHLEVGMIIDQDIHTHTGLLLVGRGQEATFPMLARLRNFHHNKAIADTIRVLIARPAPDDDVVAITSQDTPALHPAS